MYTIVNGYLHMLDEHVKLSCVAESAAPLHVACGVGTAGVEGACSGSCWHSLTATVCGRLISCSCASMCEQYIVLIREQTSLSA